MSIKSVEAGIALRRRGGHGMRQNARPEPAFDSLARRYRIRVSTCYLLAIPRVSVSVRTRLY